MLQFTETLLRAHYNHEAVIWQSISMIPQFKFNAVFVSSCSAGNTVKAKNLLCLKRFNCASLARSSYFYLFKCSCILKQDEGLETAPMSIRDKWGYLPRISGVMWRSRCVGGFQCHSFLVCFRALLFSHFLSSTLIFTHLTFSLLLPTGAARLAAVGCMVPAYETARRERRPGAAPVCPPLAALLLGLPERQHPKPSGPHLASAAPAEPGSSPNRAPARGAPSPPRPVQHQQQREPSLHGLPEHGRPFNALRGCPEE